MIRPPHNVRYIFVGGFHHSGTSLVHTVLAESTGVASLLGSDPVHEDEGARLQRVYSTLSDRKHHTCSPYPLALCLTELDALVDTEAKRLLARTQLLDAWSPFWQRTNASALVRVEKDPDLGTLFLKHALFAPATLVAVMRHPLYSHSTFSSLCSSVFDCVRLWTITWAHTLQRMRSVSSFAIVRYEDFASGETACWTEFMIHNLSASKAPMRSSGSEGAAGRRSLFFGLRGGNSNDGSEELVRSHYVWAWVARPDRQPLLREQLTSELEGPMRALSGYSLVAPKSSSVSSTCGLVICSSAACAFDGRMRAEGRTILKRLQAIARWQHWDQIKPLEAAVQSTFLESSRQPPTSQPPSPLPTRPSSSPLPTSPSSSPLPTRTPPSPLPTRTPPSPLPSSPSSSPLPTRSPPSLLPPTTLARAVAASGRPNSFSVDQSERVDPDSRFWWGWVAGQLTLVAFAGLLVGAYSIATRSDRYSTVLSTDGGRDHVKKDAE